MPISWRGTLQQYVGRLHRLHDSKREVIVYDYVDGCVPVLSAMYSKRVRGYEAVGIKFRTHKPFLPNQNPTNSRDNRFCSIPIMVVAITTWWFPTWREWVWRRRR